MHNGAQFLPVLTFRPATFAFWLLQDLKFATPEGRAIYLALFNPPARNVSKQFEPRRSAFVYELDEDAATDVPTTLRRSAADCPPVRHCLGWNGLAWCRQHTALPALSRA